MTDGGKTIGTDGAEVDLSGRHGRYEIERLLGRGGMGAVYLAKQLDLGRTVVIKVIAAGNDKDSSYVERLRREAQAAARIDSDNVVKVFETGRLAGHPFIAMEYVDGSSVSALTAGRGYFVPPIAAAIVLAAARALEKAHGLGIVHRDMKPANILLCKDGRVKVADFGLAKFLAPGSASPTPGQALTAPGSTVGTPAYMSPEQAQGLDVDGRADVYALGVTFFELMTGRQPFVGTTIRGTIALRLAEDPPPPRSLVPSIPESFERACLALMTRDPEERPAIGQAIALLEPLVGPHPAAALAKLFAPVDAHARTQADVAVPTVTRADPATRPSPPRAEKPAPTLIERRRAVTVAEVPKEPAPARPLLWAGFAVAAILVGGGLALVGHSDGPHPPEPPPKTETPKKGPDLSEKERELALREAKDRAEADAIERERKAVEERERRLKAEKAALEREKAADRKPDEAPNKEPERLAAATADLKAALLARSPEAAEKVRDALEQGARSADADALLQAATLSARLLRAFEKALEEIPSSRRPDMGTAEPRDLFRPFVDRAHQDGKAWDADVRGAATLLMAAQRAGLPRELYLARDAKNAPGPDVRKTLELLQLPYPELARPPEDGPPPPPDDR
ncbi:MAG TPA: protein kinase [Planctomycetota bacterium]|nr:protein kinase [Planctomycetota bacterium]